MKINRKAFSVIGYWLLAISFFGLLIYSRFVNLGWGLPYGMHPDERNMANAVQGLKCELPIRQLANCFNPHFFAYGQFSLYLGYLLIWAVKGFRDFGKIVINFELAVLSLRIISAVASVMNAIVIIKIIRGITKKGSYPISFVLYLFMIFSPFFIQFSHFGTTESLLMLLYSLIVYLSMNLLKRRTTDAVVWLSLVSGVAVATKVSSVIFLAVPIVVLISQSKLSSKIKVLSLMIIFLIFTSIFAIFFSPHNLINFQEFAGSMRYESDVALGRALVFYTRQFFRTVPIWFQLTKVFPYVLGWPVLIMAGLGFFGGLGWKDKKINLLRLAVFIYFIPSAFFYAKWTRFISPVFPLITIFAILFMQRIIFRINRRFWIPAFAGMTLLLIIPGVAYLSIYQNPDIRLQASEWIYKNIPANSYILSETANVVDIPVQHNKYQVISFNFYDLDESPELQSELKEHLRKADYIFVPSRRVFANHPKDKYPLLNDYYSKLFSGRLGFSPVAEFKSLPDEGAEETWTVFDHPVIRIYRKVKS